MLRFRPLSNFFQKFCVFKYRVNNRLHLNNLLRLLSNGETDGKLKACIGCIHETLGFIWIAFGVFMNLLDRGNVVNYN